MQIEKDFVVKNFEFMPAHFVMTDVTDPNNPVEHASDVIKFVLQTKNGEFELSEWAAYIIKKGDYSNSSMKIHQIEVLIEAFEGYGDYNEYWEDAFSEYLIPKLQELTKPYIDEVSK